MWDVDLRNKTTSLHNDSWLLIDNRGARALLFDKATQCLSYTNNDCIRSGFLPGDAPRYSIIRLPILNNHTFSNSLEG